MWQFLIETWELVNNSELYNIIKMIVPILFIILIWLLKQRWILMNLLSPNVKVMISLVLKIYREEIIIEIFL